ncbi:MAG: hypothetical protein JF591_08165 [Lysobacter sp.]|nr:hypothetical protein [Lysobacter sp.]
MLLAVATLSLSATAFAQHSPTTPPDTSMQRTEPPVNDQHGDSRTPPAPNDAIGPATFAELDTNGDGKISRDEAALDARLTANFSIHDLNGDGALSPTEYQAGQSKPTERGKVVDEK